MRAKGRAGGLASARARERKREALRLKAAELEAARVFALDALHAAERQLAKDQAALATRKRAFVRESHRWEEEERERIAEALKEERRALQREHTRLTQLRDEVGRVEAEAWIKARREALRRADEVLAS